MRFVVLLAMFLVIVLAVVRVVVNGDLWQRVVPAPLG